MPNAYKQITVSDRQCITDIAVQEYGCTDGKFLLLQDNANLQALHQVIEPGTKLNIRITVPRLNNTNQAVARLYAGKKHHVLSETGATTYPTTLYVNAGYWQLDYGDKM